MEDLLNYTTDGAYAEAVESYNKAVDDFQRAVAKLEKMMKASEASRNN